MVYYKRDHKNKVHSLSVNCIYGFIRFPDFLWAVFIDKSFILLLKNFQLNLEFKFLRIKLNRDKTLKS